MAKKFKLSVKADQGRLKLLLTRLQSKLKSNSKSKTPTNSVLPASQRIPREIWNHIFSYLLEPRVLIITLTKRASNWLWPSIRLHPSLERIPGALFVDHATKTATLKTHTVSFARITTKPILYNKDTDVLQISGLCSIIDFIIRTHWHRNGRKQEVRFLALDYSQDTARTLRMWRNRKGDGILKDIAALVSTLGKVEKLFVVRNTNEISEPDLVQWREDLRDRVEFYFSQWQRHWDHQESRGIEVRDKWSIPEVIVARNQDELLRLVSA